ncbi:MAG TPA: cyclic nucleotide-binding domain-containing protein [Vicinamibacteria bacterium]|nr:cyclic nucleotide-binding domain-containing protein [Vicinamibacteria bacterium]
MLDEGRLLEHEQRISGPVERILYLKRLPIVSTLGGAQLASVAEQMGERFFPRGSVMLREGEPPAALFFPVEGVVHITRGGRVLGHAGPGLAVAPFHLLARDEQGVGAVAETDTLALELPADRLVEICDDNFAVLHHVIREVSRQIVDQVVKVPGAVTFLGAPGEEARTPARELDLVERIFFLRRAPVFTKASISALAQLSRGLTEVRLPAGVTLWREGEPTGWASMIVSGRVRCTSSRGHAFTPGPGVALGALDAVADMPRWFDAVTETPVVALQGNMQTLVNVFEDNFAMAMEYLSVTARWLLVILERSLGSKDRLQRVYGCAPEAEAISGVVATAAATGGSAS